VGILDIFGGSPEQKAKKLKSKITQKYGDPAARQKAISQLGALKTPEAVRSLLARFTIMVDPHTIDADEKEQVFHLIQEVGHDAVEPVKEFLARSDHASSWAIRLLEALLPEAEVTTVALQMLTSLGAEYTRDPEKKTVLILHLTGKDDPRIAGALVPFLDDPSDDVKLVALRGLGPLKHEPAREPLLRLLTSPGSARRVQTAAIAALHESELGVQGFREKVEALLPEPYFVDKSGLVKKRG
jgi:HEAT repeat protein